MKPNFKRFLSLMLAIVITVGLIPLGAARATDVNAPALPTATVTEIANDELTFAMNFKADEVTDEQLAYYDKWFADFELTINKDVTFNSNGGADGYLSGQYDEWGNSWVDVPPTDVTLKAGEPLKIMAYAAKLKDNQDLKYTYGEVYTGVCDFDCGVYFTPEFLAANPDLEVTLELRMYNPADERESYAVGETYTFDASDLNAPALPTATVTEIANDELTFAMNFKADEVTDEQLAYYDKWFADFELTINKDVTFNSNGGADGYLSGQYDEWGNSWVDVPPTDVTLKAGEPLKIMAYAAKLKDNQDLKYTYGEVYTGVCDFDCGVYFTPEFLAANPDLEVTLELRMYNPADESESYAVGETYTFDASDLNAPALPTATITTVSNQNLTFAMNFKADEITDEQLAYYDKWFADFELTINKDVTFNANGGADGYLAGQYDGWSKSWVNVPGEDVTLKAGETLKIMAFAAELKGEPGLKYTYGEVYTGVCDFDCGVYFTPEFLAANPDLEVTLELRMYNPADESESYTVGETYVFDQNTPALPTATITEIANEDLTFAMNFKADEVTDEQLAYYDKWFADFELTINKDVTFNANGGADGYLAGQYDDWSKNWVNVPGEDVTLKAGETLKIMAFAAELMGEPGLKYTYGEVYTGVRDFDCGVFFEPEFLAANPDLEVTLELRVYNPEDESETYVIGETYYFDAADALEEVAKNTKTAETYSSVQDALDDAKSGETVIVLKDHNENAGLVLKNGVTLDLNGCELEVNYLSAFKGNYVTDSTDNGILKVGRGYVMLQKNNPMLPIWNGADGYVFTTYTGYQDRLTRKESSTIYLFLPSFDRETDALLAAGSDVSGVELLVNVSWGSNGKKFTQSYTFDDGKVKDVYTSFNAATNKYGSAFQLTLNSSNSTLNFEAVFVSETGVEIVCGK